MSTRTIDPGIQADLRQRAVSRLTGRESQDAAFRSASAAFAVLHELASDPTTAADALALLHELQVHQVELDLQAEELRTSRAELEGALDRQITLYDRAPVGYFTVGLDGALHELNLSGAAMLGSERDALLGQILGDFLAPDSASVLQATLTRISQGHRGEPCMLHLAPPGGESKAVCATVCADPAGGSFLVAFMNTVAHRPGAAGAPED